MRHMRIAVTLVDGVFDSGLSAVLDIFATANALSGTSRFEVVRLGASPEITSGQGARHPAKRFRGALGAFDHVLVTGFGASNADEVKQRLRDDDLKATVSWVVTQHAHKTPVHAACSGTWVLGAGGLLDGREATTSWWFADAFQAAFPRVRLDARYAVVRSGALTTAGAAFAHVDLALDVLRRESPSLASRVADHLVTESRPSQALYLVEHHARVDDPLVRAFEREVTASLSGSVDLPRIAKRLGTSLRSLQRKLTAVSGRSPLQFVRQLRLRRALALVQKGEHSIEEIAAQVGYQSAHTLRQLIRKELGTGVRELRGRRQR
ncbi:helix-turn-helix domain-containing protein [Pyxidicoccus parkwayensis]|uniref:Helix-turn-helix domain-containing protein n=1 Tax=Pyxidicoccus parkwayensis TaxID=2813578 RepID=A0ABX7NYW5_9BACT|nr:helix-turn-helix domain-containing protein [Pyxidicoccus parkwaysis]QSQ22672.1 helix-turn-helix domain-containing protein [Pyxidicoccus parkwaysis]